MLGYEVAFKDFFFSSKTKNAALSAAGPLRATQVFADGEVNLEHTYVARKEVERTILDELSRPNYVVHLHGPSKSGKSVITEKIQTALPKVWISGAGIKSSDEFWGELAGKLAIPERVEIANMKANETRVRVDFGGTGGVNGVGFRGNAGRDKLDREENQNRNVFADSKKVATRIFLERHKHLIVIDDFHFVGEALQVEILESFKSLIARGCGLLIISVTDKCILQGGQHADIMDGRLLSVDFPSWTDREIRQIAEMGFKLLNVEPSEETYRGLVGNSIRNPKIMQGLCLEICRKHGVTQTLKKPKPVNETKDTIGELIPFYIKSQTNSLANATFSKEKIGDARIKLKPRIKSSSLTVGELFVFSISHQPPFVPIRFDNMVKRCHTFLDKNAAPKNLKELLYNKALEAANELGSRKGSKPPIYIHPDGQELQIVDPYFKLWARWNFRQELAKEIFKTKKKK